MFVLYYQTRDGSHTPAAPTGVILKRSAIATGRCCNHTLQHRHCDQHHPPTATVAAKATTVGSCEGSHCSGADEVQPVPLQTTVSTGAVRTGGLREMAAGVNGQGQRRPTCRRQQVLHTNAAAIQGENSQLNATHAAAKNTHTANPPSLEQQARMHTAKAHTTQMHRQADMPPGRYCCTLPLSSRDSWAISSQPSSRCKSAPIKTGVMRG